MSSRILWLTHMLLAYNGYHQWQTWMNHLWNILLFILIKTHLMQLTLHQIQVLFAQSIEIFSISYCMMPNFFALAYFIHLFILLLCILDMLPWFYNSHHVTFHLFYVAIPFLCEHMMQGLISTNAKSTWVHKFCGPFVSWLASNSLKDSKCESQTENNERARSWGTFFGSQHFGRVEGRAGALGWD
jgi:hypothetical protein